MGEIDKVAASDARRVEFNALHQWSTRLEVVVLVLGLISIYDFARPQKFARVIAYGQSLPKPDARPPVYPAT